MAKKKKRRTKRKKKWEMKAYLTEVAGVSLGMVVAQRPDLAKGVGNSKVTYAGIAGGFLHSQEPGEFVRAVAVGMGAGGGGVQYASQVVGDVVTKAGK